MVGPPHTDPYHSAHATEAFTALQSAATIFSTAANAHLTPTMHSRLCTCARKAMPCAARQCPALLPAQRIAGRAIALADTFERSSTTLVDQRHWQVLRELSAARRLLRVVLEQRSAS